MTPLSILKRIESTPWIAEGLALLAGILYLLQSWSYAHTQQSVLDEGAYLYKGVLFLTGQYTIYQDYGPWSNHMPLAFLIPGVIQVIFGPGLRTGRYFAILIGLIALLGLWLVAKRQAGRWWAALVVLVIAANPAIIKMQSTAVSQVLIACMFAWTLWFTLGENRNRTQIILGAVLAGILLMTRINMLPVLPLLVLYVFWQHGSRMGWIAALAGGLTVVIGHALFWPGILKMWAYWLPEGLTPFLNGWRPNVGGIRYWDPESSTSGRILSFFHMIRYQFVAVMGTFTTWLLWPKKESWKKQSDFRSAVFLSALFLSLLIIHMWATLMKNYCLFCLAGYITFFASSGLLLITISFPIWRTQLPRWRSFILMIFLIILCTGIGYGAFEDIGNPMLDMPLPEYVRNFISISGSVTLGKVLQVVFQQEQRIFRRPAPTAAGLIIGVLIILSVLLAQLFLAWRRKATRWSSGSVALIIALLLGTILSPTIILGAGYSTYDCNTNMIAANEAAGKHLAQYIPEGSSVYWKGGLSAAPLLYLPRIKIYPAQLNGDYSYIIGGDLGAIRKYGFWNEEIARQWVSESDFVLIQERYYRGWLKQQINDGSFVEMEISPSTIPCRQDAQIHIFRKKQ